MKFEIKIKTIYQCSLERAFKTPMLCDLSKIHTGYGIMPKVTHTQMPKAELTLAIFTQMYNSERFKI